jgi:hypothetical protein
MNSARILLHLIQQFVTEQQIIRIMGPDGWRLMTINSQSNPQVAGFNDITALEFDIEVDESIETATLRMINAQYLAEYARNNPGSVPPDILAEYSGLPMTLQLRLREFWEQSQKRAAELEDREYQLQKDELLIKAKAAERSQQKAK